MWLILLDRSGSMGDPFEGGVEFGGRVRTTQEKIKLDAAKAALREHLAGLGVPTAIALITFDSAASVVYEGTSADAAAIARALDDVTAGGGTDVAAALDAAAERVRGDEGSGRARALLISDGLADADAADAAAERARTDGVVAIDVILIDPTDKGLDVARRVAAGGSVAAVASPEALQQDVRRAAREQQLTSGDPEAVSAVARQDASDVLAGAESGEPVAFTAAYPGSVLAGVWYSLVLYLHLARLQDVVDALVDRRAGELGSTPVSVHAAAFSQIRRGTTLRLTPMVDGLVFNPSSQEVAWIEDMQQSTFRVAAPVDSQAGPRGGVLEVHAGPLLVALVPLAVRIRTPSEPEEPDTRTTQRPLQRVFASYAHVDEDVVRACAEAYKAFGIHVLIDKETLRSGERWEETLHRLIDESDQFQLFWSSSARGSQYVEDEWQHALRLQGAKGEQFIRPLYWELPLPDPPSELGHLHFARLDVAELARASRQPPEPTPEAQRGMRPPPSVPVVVVPLLPFVAQTRVDEVRADAAEAAAFVETISGRRYYPAPTLLVDEHAVRTIRDTLSPVDRPLPDSVPPVIRTELLALLDVLKAIALTFHVRRLHPDLDDDTFAARFGEGTVLPAAEWSARPVRAPRLRGDGAAPLSETTSRTTSPAAWRTAFVTSSETSRRTSRMRSGATEPSISSSAPRA